MKRHIDVWQVKSERGLKQYLGYRNMSRLRDAKEENRILRLLLMTKGIWLLSLLVCFGQAGLPEFPIHARPRQVKELQTNIVFYSVTTVEEITKLEILVPYITNNHMALVTNRFSGMTTNIVSSVTNVLQELK